MTWCLRRLSPWSPARPAGYRPGCAKPRAGGGKTSPAAPSTPAACSATPPGDSAGRLIDSLGLKGLRRGGARVSTRHANFFVADPGAAAQDVYDLVHEVRRLVRERAGVLLEPEVRFAGPFRGVLDEARGRAGGREDVFDQEEAGCGQGEDPFVPRAGECASQREDGSELEDRSGYRPKAPTGRRAEGPVADAQIADDPGRDGRRGRDSLAVQLPPI